ncbi:flagellar hook-associated protein FlgK [Nesterenkonia halotolerans]|uniref:Flagellar hook-associated protein 1 n=1 Tax=Nesterenkonia halotolerans TaxID=225325 RepID=A0ABR9J648_9MICC|nr:flagellar hook-associated protein FlgK [Nesterenkonia halotolerans]MBE1514474.1 flagellar hook-associated protein 1 FlgK [Nesterenkonia halotolerans]
MSTFSGLNTAWTGMTAARRSMETAGANIAHVGVDGYTRQRVETSSVTASSSIGRLAGPTLPGQGVTVTGIARLADAQLDSRVRGTAGISGQAETVAAGLEALEASFREPGTDGLSARLSDFWAGWDDVANQPGEQAPAAVVIARGTAVADHLGQLHGELTQQWTSQHRGLSAEVAEVNATAQRVAALNGQIRSTTASGGNANSLMDERTQLTTRLAELTGATVRQQPDGTADVLVGGTPLVSGTNARAMELTGGARPQDAEASALSWAHRAPGDPSSTVDVQSGVLSGRLAMLAPAEADGTGGPIAVTLRALDGIATDLATRVNAVQAEGFTTAGSPGGAFFAIDPTRPAASLRVVAAGANDLAAGAPGAGALDGSNAAKMAALAELGDGPDALWSQLVISTGTNVQNGARSAVNASMALVSALEQQQSQAGVSLDEENLALVTHQHAYQGAARVLTAIDEMLDTLINRTGVVGR